MIPTVSAGSKSRVLESRMPKMFRNKSISPGGNINGVLELPGDKSISHRYAILAALAEGKSEILNYSSAADCKSTLGCLRHLGVEVHQSRERLAHQPEKGWTACRLLGVRSMLKTQAAPCACSREFSRDNRLPRQSPAMPRCGRVPCVALWSPCERWAQKFDTHGTIVRRWKSAAAHCIP